MYHSFLFVFLKTLSYWSSFVDGLWLETFRFEVGVRNANFSTSTEEIDHLGVIAITVIAKPPDCRRPNKVNNTFFNKLLSLLFQVALLYNIMAERLTHIRYTRETTSFYSLHIKQRRYLFASEIFSFYLNLFISFCVFCFVFSRLVFCVQVGATKKNDGNRRVIVTTFVRHAHMQKEWKKSRVGDDDDDKGLQ